MRNNRRETKTSPKGKPLCKSCASAQKDGITFQLESDYNEAPLPDQLLAACGKNGCLMSLIELNSRSKSSLKPPTKGELHDFNCPNDERILTNPNRRRKFFHKLW